ncbi:Yip1 family protein [Halosimplex amylolyticum]|uniref:Yip1 family protein n=1 Tax=Halosimplex amylolyticum TaxID=3396616 RepID=UPI003F56EB58
MPSVLALLTDPDEFFRRRLPDPSLKGPAAVVAVVAVVSVLASILQFRFLSQVFESGGAGSGFVMAIRAVSIGAAFVLPFVFWLLYAGLFHGISALLDGDGEFSTILSLVGWGYVPNVLGTIAGAAVNYYRFNVRGIDVPTEMTMEAYQQFSQSLQTGPLVALSAVLSIVFTLWSAFLWTFALKHARDLTLRQAVITIAVPVGLGLLWTVRTLLVALEVL